MTQRLLRDLRSQRAAVRWYQRRARELAELEAELRDANRPLHARKTGAYAEMARTAAVRENSPENGT